MSIWKYSSPQYFYPLAKKMATFFFLVAAILTVWGLYIGFFVAPTDFQQGESYRIIFIHVPAAYKRCDNDDRQTRDQPMCTDLCDHQNR
jgi:heme exporter protein C